MKNRRNIIILLSLLVSTVVLFADNVLILRPDNVNFNEIEKGIKDEIGSDFTVKTLLVNKKSDIKTLTYAIETDLPKVVVLMDNTAIRLFKNYRKLTGKDVPPAVACAGSFIDKAIENIKNCAGITYEIPIVTSVRNLRAVLKRDIKTVGIVHRKFLDEFVERNREYCEPEKISLIDVEVRSGSSIKKGLKSALKKLIEENKVDAFWVPNDNVILTPSLIQSVWIPAVKKYKIPVIVGVEILVRPQINVGTFAVLPDNISLGSQVGSKISDIAENNFAVEKPIIEPPISVYKIINIRQVRNFFGISSEDITNVDKKLK